MKCFNSILVRLKGKGTYEYLDYLDGFNSILVRLKAEVKIAALAISGFQFHTGSIKSQEIAEKEGFDNVSIPYWFD